MVDTPRFSNAGGFLPDGITSLPSPAPSTASNRAAARLPHPRSKPLVRGSKKEDYARNYVSDRLMHISRRYVKKHGIPDPADEVTGYESMDQVCRDLEEVVDVLWFSGTPSLQIPYLLNVALAFNTYLPSFPPSPAPTFALLKKLDHCFASLLIGRDLKSGDPLPGFQGNGRGFTRTDMVRCKSLTDETRMLVSMVMSDEPDVENVAGDGDGDDGAGRSPVRRNVSVSLSTGLIQSPVGDSVDGDADEVDGDADVKFEDVDVMDFDNESASGGKDGSNHTAVKRKFKEFDEGKPQGLGQTRIKEEEEPDPKLDDAAPGNRSPVPETEGSVQRRPGEKFHFILDDDSDDNSEDEVPPNTNNITTTVVAAPPTPSTAQIAPDTEHTVGNQDSSVGEEDDDEDDEDEELHYNVGKVYERTLVQLGRSLGESLTDG
ncbi:hypothetical protein F5B19DRAFT_283800 [Rostrohypoxylon terebratum]|nr:hypothetical protein F5B19DRAFT_283800 [Rostrohypoxylon terebratum]